jgi:hypothetical protein
MIFSLIVPSRHPQSECGVYKILFSTQKILADDVSQIWFLLFKIRESKQLLSVASIFARVEFKPFAIGALAIDEIADKKFKDKKYSKVFANLLSLDIKKYAQNKTN